jgi:O-antigen/teichoic acid export membrane protein
VSALSRFSLFLAPGLAQSLVSLLLLPASTYVLDPADFGIFALVSSITGFLAVFGSVGAGYLLAKHFSALDDIGRTRLISVILIAALGIGSLLAGALVGGWWLYAAQVSQLAQVDIVCVILAAATMVLSMPWGPAVEVIRLDGSARWYAGVVISQVLVSAVTLLIALFWLDLGVISLFASAAAGALVLFAGGLLKLRPFADFRTLDAHWLKEVVRIGPAVILANVSESIHQVIERNILTLYSGFSDLGIYAHAQQYRAMASMPVSAVAHTVWPLTLEDAKSPEGEFLRTRASWTATHLVLTAIGVAMAALGAHAISLLTHDKFTEAYVLATLWVVYLIVQNTGKPQTAVFYAFGAGVRYARIQTVSMMIGTALLIFLVPAIGMYGAFCAALAQQIIMRLIVQVMARKISRAPFQDEWAVAGICVVVATLWTRHSFSTGFLWDLALAGSLLAILAVVGYKACPDVVAMLRERVLQ